MALAQVSAKPPCSTLKTNTFRHQNVVIVRRASVCEELAVIPPSREKVQASIQASIQASVHLSFTKSRPRAQSRNHGEMRFRRSTVVVLLEYLLARLKQPSMRGSGFLAVGK
jgi:hypothetical protein